MHKNIKESPDSVMVGNKELEYDDKDTISFGYYKNKMYVSDYRGMHFEINDEYNLNIPGEPRFKMKYPGRIWTKSKIITFWGYPKNHSEMKKTIEDLEKELYKKLEIKIDIWGTFKIEILVSEEKGKLTNWRFDNDLDEYVPRGYESKIIPVKSYQSSQKRTKKDLSVPHLMSPVAKQSDVPVDVGSKKTSSGLTPTQKHQMTRTSDGIIKLKSLVEYTIGKVSKQINVKIDIDKSYHAGKQQNRPEGHTSDTEIIEIVNLAIPKIANELMFDEINMGDYVLVKHRGTNINIVGALHPGQNNEIDFVVVTVMRKQNFMPKKGTKVIEV